MYNFECVAADLRRINPSVNGSALFDYNPYEMPSCESNPSFYISLAKWRFDPFDHPNLWDDLLAYQSLEKRHLITDGAGSRSFRGKLLGFRIDTTLIDGFAAVISKGFFDDYNCPPIDTWVTITDLDRHQTLVAWVPEPFLPYAHEGIEGNPEGCIGWLDEWCPELMKQIQSVTPWTTYLGEVQGLPN